MSRTFSAEREAGQEQKLGIVGIGGRSASDVLEGIGLLRLVAEQGDAQVRGSWGEAGFELRSVWDAGELEAFLDGAVRPTPFYGGNVSAEAEAAHANLKRLAEGAANPEAGCARFERLREVWVGDGAGRKMARSEVARVGAIRARNGCPDAAVAGLDAWLALDRSGRWGAMTGWEGPSDQVWLEWARVVVHLWGTEADRGAVREGLRGFLWRACEVRDAGAAAWGRYLALEGTAVLGSGWDSSAGWGHTLSTWTVPLSYREVAHWIRKPVAGGAYPILAEGKIQPTATA